MLDLFDHPIIGDMNTEGIKYAGSKKKLIKPILELVGKVSPRSVFDGFAGTTRVSQALARNGYKVFVNDKAVWSYVFANCYLQANETNQFYQEIVDHLNALPPLHGWFSENYGGYVGQSNISRGVDGGKKPFQMKNAEKLDAIRLEIERMNLTESAKSVAITSLILALERVDSTLGHYVSYLKNWSPRSFRDLKLRLPNIVSSDQQHEIFTQDTIELAPDISADLAYYDPPYGSNNEKMPPSRVRYTSYYHLWTTICQNDRPPLFGKANRRKDSSDVIAYSMFEDFRKEKNGRYIAIEAIEKLVVNTKAPHIILSYSSGGRASKKELNEVLNDTGTIIELVEISHQKNVMANMRWTNDWVKEDEGPNTEYLFLMKNKNPAI